MTVRQLLENSGMLIVLLGAAIAIIGIVVLIVSEETWIFLRDRLGCNRSGGSNNFLVGSA